MQKLSTSFGLMFGVFYLSWSTFRAKKLFVAVEKNEARIELPNADV